MENEDTKDNHDDSTEELSASTSKVEAGKKSGKTDKGKNEPGKQSKKWSLFRHWKTASRAKQISWIWKGIGGTVGIFVLLIYILQYQETVRSNHAQRMPLLINSTPPTLFQPFVCDVRNGIHTGNAQFGVKNIGSGSATHVMPYGGTIQLVPEHKRGTDYIDKPLKPNCKSILNAQELETPLAPGQWINPQLRQVVAMIPMVTSNEPVQLYWVRCVYYSEEYGGKHSTCDTYRLMLPSTNELDSINGSPTFFCDTLPKKGTFQTTVGGSCHEDQ